MLRARKDNNAYRTMKPDPWMETVHKSDESWRNAGESLAAKLIYLYLQSFSTVAVCQTVLILGNNRKHGANHKDDVSYRLILPMPYVFQRKTSFFHFHSVINHLFPFLSLSPRLGLFYLPPPINLQIQINSFIRSTCVWRWYQYTYAFF